MLLAVLVGLSPLYHSPKSMTGRTSPVSFTSVWTTKGRAFVPLSNGVAARPFARMSSQRATAFVVADR